MAYKRARGPMQEKFEVQFPVPATGEDAWVSDTSVRKAKPIESQRVTESDISGGRLNRLPPGTNIEDQSQADIRPQPFSMGGTTDVSADYNAGAVDKGYRRLPMSPTEDEYNNEHQDAFYGEVEVDGDTGFCERNNVLDRQ